jgi:hypothetical protein
MDCRVKPGNDEMVTRSRDAFQRPSYATPLSEIVTSGLDTVWSMLSCSRQMPVEAFASVAIAWIAGHRRELRDAVL